MLYQLEITTHCNFECFYCAGRDMPQRHMAWDLFERILGGVPAGDHVVSLQGEGEPTVHPRFWDMVGAVKARGLRPFTITNCSHVDAARFAAAFPTIAVSIDTLDPAEAERIGRYKLDRVLQQLDELCAQMGASRIHVMTVDYGQPLDAVREFAAARGFGHTVQPLQAKDDYAERYPGRIEASPRRYTYRCRYLEQPLRRYYDIEGREYPCCFIKDPRHHEPIDALRAKMAARDLPAACAGCSEVLAPERRPQPKRAAPAPDAPGISIITVCAADAPGLRQVLSRMAAQSQAEVLAVDIGSPGGAAGRLESEWPNVRVVRMKNAPGAVLPRARNHGARHARSDWLCFVDADVLLGERFAELALKAMAPGEFICARGAPWLTLCRRTDYLATEGYDEVLEGCEQADWDLALRLDMLGRKARPLPAGSLTTTGHAGAARFRFRGAQDGLDATINAVYVQIKRDLMCERGRKALPQAARRSLYDNVRTAARKAATTGQLRATVNVALPDQLAIPAGGGGRLKRVWRYTLELAAPPPAAQAEAALDVFPGGAA